MKTMFNGLPSRQALRIIRKLQRLHGPNHGGSLLEEAEAALNCGNTQGATAGLEKFLLVTVDLDGEKRGLVLMALDHLRSDSLLKKTVSSVIRLGAIPVGHLLHSWAKSLLNSFERTGTRGRAKETNLGERHWAGVGNG